MPDASKRAGRAASRCVGRYSELLTSITSRAGLSSVETRNGRSSSTPDRPREDGLEASRADELRDGGRRRREALRAGVRPWSGLLGEVGVERGLHPDEQHGAAVDLDLVAGAVGDDRPLDVADVVARQPVAELEDDAVVAVVRRGADVGEKRDVGARALDDDRIGRRALEHGAAPRARGAGRDVVPVRRRRLVVRAATAGEEERCDRHEEGADHHLLRTVASPAPLVGALRGKRLRRGSLRPWRD